MNCDVCGTSCVAGITSWHFVCPSCGTECSTFEPNINDSSRTTVIDEAKRACGLKAVRTQSYRIILNSLATLSGVGRGRLLEIGSAHGWFLEAAAKSFKELVGIEPDDKIRTQSGSSRVNVRGGFFPNAVNLGEKFDVIVFNDVFEHIPRPLDVTRIVAAHLAPNGVVLISLPVSTGFLYRVAKRLARLGFARPFSRLWQEGYPSPHLYYFSPQGLTRLFASRGLSLEMTQHLHTIEIDGLWQRIRYGEGSWIMAASSYIAAIMLAPFLSLLPADTAAFFFRNVTHTKHGDADGDLTTGIR